MADLDSIEEAKRKAEAAAITAQYEAANKNRYSTPSPYPAPPAEAPTPDMGNTRAADYAQRGLPTGNVSQGDAAPIGLDNPQTGSFINQTGTNLGPTNVDGRYQGNPAGAVGIQGQLSPQEQSFWAANPNGAVKDPTTGVLVGLGAVAPESPSRTIVNEGLGPPATPWIQQDRINTGVGVPGMTPAEARAQPQPLPDFLHIPEVDPALLSQRQNIQSELARTLQDLKTADTKRHRGRPSQYDILNQRYTQLSQANNSLGAEHYRQTDARTQAILKNTDLQDKYRIGQDVQGAARALMGVQSAPGTPEHARELAQISLNYPNALKDKSFESKLLSAAQFHKGQEASRQQALAANLIPVTTGYGQRGETIKYMTPAEHSQHQLEGINKELKTKGLPFGVNSIFNPLGGHHAVDKSKAYDQLGPTDIIKVPYVKQGGGLAEAKVSKATLESLKEQYGERYRAAGGEFPAQAPPAGGNIPPPGGAPGTPRVRNYNPETGKLE